MSEYYTLGNWDSKGVPNYLHSIEQLEPNLLNRIITTIPEKNNLAATGNSLITNTESRDILIQTNDENFTGCDVYVSFLYEGAGYKNVVGYYTYPLNGGYTVPTKWNSSTSSWTPMTYSDRNSVDVNGKSILKKTIIFPNASLPVWANSNGTNAMAGGGNLLPGSKVKILYDVSNPSVKFPNNTGIGFFLIPNGWNGTTVTNWAERVHTGSVFNANNSVQSILLVNAQDSTTEKGEMVICFEDIMRPGGDSDFNDVIIRAEYTPSYCVSSGTSILPSSDPVTENKLVVDRTGVYISLTSSTYNTIKNSNATTITIRHEIIIDDDTNGHRTLLFNNLQQFELENGFTVSFSGNTIIISTTINKSSFQSNTYIIYSFRNIDKTSSYNPNVSALVEFQNLYVHKQDSIQEKLSVTNNTNSSKFIDNTNLIPCINQFSSPYAMGDPHILTVFGKRLDLPNTVQTYKLYDDGELNIVAKTNYFYQNDKYPEYKDLTFIEYVQVSLGNEKIVINMFHPDTYYYIKNNELKKIDHLKKIDQLTNSKFELNADYKYYNERFQLFEEANKTGQCEMRYIKFDTVQLGTVYLELYFLTHRKDYVNSFSIMCKNMAFLPNSTGVMVNYNKNCMIDDISYLK